MAHRSAIILGAVALAATALSTPGHAAPGFISDVTTLTSALSASHYAVALAPDGTAHATWVEETGSNFLLMAASRPRGGTWTAAVQVDTGSTTQDAEPSMAVDGQGRVVAAWRDYLPGRAGSVIRTATLSGRDWSASQDLSPTTTHAFEPDVALDARGDAAIVWTEDIGTTSTRHVAGAQRSAEGSWTTSDITAVAGAGAATVAVQPDGRAVAVWTQDSTVQTADKALGAEAWGTARQLSAGNGQDLDAVVDHGGQVIAAWRTSGFSGASTIETATRPAAGDWGPTTVLASATTGLIEQPALGIGESGEALAAWVQRGDGNRVSDLWTATRTTSGSWSTTQVASPQVYNSSPTVGFGTGGASVVLWIGSTEQLGAPSYDLYAVTRTPGHGWTAPTALASGSLGRPRVAVDPDGFGTLLWSDGASLRTQVFDGVAPSIEQYSATEFARIGQAASYSASATDLWSAPSVTWRFDGRTPVTGGEVSRTFSSSGVHRVQFAATDAALNTTTRDSVTIVADRHPRLRHVRLTASVVRVSGPKAARRARLSYRLSAPALVRVQVLDRSGRVVATVNRALNPGARALPLTAKRLELGTGRYTVRVSARNALGRALSAKLPLRIKR